MRINDYITEGAGKFLVNRKAVNADSDGFIEGDFKCVFAYSGSSQAVSCASYKREDDEITALLDKRITHNMTQNFQKHNANVAIYDAGSERVVLRGHRLQECSIVSGDESVRRVRMAFKRIEIVEDDMHWPMNGLESYIQESAPHFLVSKKRTDSTYGHAPKTKIELRSLIERLIEEEGKECDLNGIDVSRIDDMSGLFSGTQFNGNISEWDVSNVTNMSSMFRNTTFNGDISEWDVSNVKNMHEMFYYSAFNRDISKWNVSNVRNMSDMFGVSKFNGDISRWDVRKTVNMSKMFADSYFDGDISGWDTESCSLHFDMFDDSPLENRPEKHPKFKK